MQIFSRSVASGLRKYMIDPKYSALLSGCEPTILFTEKINDLFDLLNTHKKSEAIKACNSWKIFEVRYVHIIEKCDFRLHTFLMT